MHEDSHNLNQRLLFLFVLLSLSVATATDISADDFECNGFNCGSGWSGAWEYSGSCEMTQLSSPKGAYQMRGTSNCIATRYFDNQDYEYSSVSFWASASSLESGDVCRYYYYDGSTYQQIFQISDGQDDGALRYNSFNVSVMSGSSGIRMISPITSGDYCYIDSIVISGSIPVQTLEVFTEERYRTGQEDVTVEMTSNLAGIGYTLRLIDSYENVFCERQIVSSFIPSTPFSVSCDMPMVSFDNAMAYMFQTDNPSESAIRYFNIVEPVIDESMFDIERVYFSRQVLQGGSTEIFALIDIDQGLSLDRIKVKLTYPDNTTRDLFMYPTGNVEEYRAFITDTFQTGQVIFQIDADSGIYHDSYSNSYHVIPFRLDYVENVGNVDDVYIPGIEVHGTEYSDGSDGTVFLLLTDGDGLPITGATCSMDMYYPKRSGYLHDKFIDSALMLYNQDGMYYYDFITPSTEGLYMVNAECSYETDNNFYFTIESGSSPTRSVISGTFTGDTFVLNDYSEWLYTQCSSSGGAVKSCDSYLEWNITDPTRVNITRLDVLFLGENTITSTMYMYWWNWSSSSWVSLPNSLIFSATASGGVPSGIDEYISNMVPLAAINDGQSVRIRFLTQAGSTFKQFNNWVTLRTSQFDYSIQELRGSGEVHVTPSSSDSNRFFKVLTCDGFLDGRCGEFTDDDEYDMVEGEIDEYITILATSTRDDVSISYTSPYSVDCTALYDVREWNGTDWVVFEDYTLYSEPSNENCIITLNKDIVSSYEYNFYIEMDNYMKWEVEWTQKQLNVFNDRIIEYCSGRNHDYTVPLTDYTIISNDSFTYFCHEAYDDMYWSEYYHNESDEITDSGEYASYVQTARFYRDSILNRYYLIANDINKDSTITFISGTDYSPSDNGKIFLQLDLDGIPVDGALCDLNLYYPNNTIWMSNQLLTYLNGSEGMYYYDFIVPDTIGIYMMNVMCQYVPLTVTYHPVSIRSQNIISGSVTNVQISDDSHLILKEERIGAVGTNYYNMSSEFIFDNLDFQDSIYRIDVGVEGYYGKDLNVSIFDFSSGDYIVLPNILQEHDHDVLVTNMIDSNISNYRNLTNSSKIKITLRDNFDIHQSLLSYNFYDQNDVIKTSTVTAINDGLTWQVNIDGYGRKQRITTTSSMTNETVIRFRVAPVDGGATNKYVVLHDVTGGTQYGRFQLTTAAGVYQNYSVILKNVSLINNVYLSDAVQGGNMNVIFDYIQVNDYSFRDTFNIDDVFLRETYLGDVSIQTIRGGGEINVRMENSSIITTTFIGGTEYVPGEQGISAVRLIRPSGSVETGATCNLTILYPNQTIFISSSMAEYADGVYTYSFTVPSVEGIYVYYSDCVKGGLTYKAMSAFHVSNVLIEIPANVWNYTNRSLTESEEIMAFLREINSTINSQIIYIREINSTTKSTLDGLKNLNSTINVMNSTITSIYSDTQSIIDDIDCDGISDTPLCSRIMEINTTVHDNYDLLLTLNTNINNNMSQILNQLNYIQNNFSDVIYDISILQSYLNCEVNTQDSVCWRLSLIENNTILINDTVTYNNEILIYINNTWLPSINLTYEINLVLTKIRQFREFEDESIYLITDSIKSSNDDALKSFKDGNIESAIKSMEEMKHDINILSEKIKLMDYKRPGIFIVTKKIFDDIISWMVDLWPF